MPVSSKFVCISLSASCGITVKEPVYSYFKSGLVAVAAPCQAPTVDVPSNLNVALSIIPVNTIFVTVYVNPGVSPLMEKLTWVNKCWKGSISSPDVLSLFIRLAATKSSWVATSFTAYSKVGYPSAVIFKVWAGEVPKNWTFPE